MIADFPLKRFYNPGGYSSFLFVPAYDVSLYPVINQAKTLTALGLHNTAAFLKGYATYESLSLIEKADQTDDGVVVATQVNGFAPGEKSELINLFTQMERMRFIVIVKDSLGRKRLVGSKLYPLQFKADFNSGDRRADAKGMTFQFYGNCRYKAPVYDDTLPAPDPVPEVAVTTYYNVAKSASKNNCAAGFASDGVQYMIQSGEFSSVVSQAEADSLAQQYVQNLANAQGSCTPSAIPILMSATKSNGNIILQWNLNGSSPVAITVQYSYNQVDWTNSTGSAVSPRSLSSSFFAHSTIYFRLRAEGAVNQTPSNILSYDNT